MRLDLCWLVGLALYVVVFSPNANADARIKCPEKCKPQQTGIQNVATLSAEACSKSIVFAYEAQLENTESALNTDVYNLTILTSFREDGVEDPTDETRIFISRSTCKANLNMKPGNIYLIMGKSAKEVAGKYHYVFDEETWVQYWPTEEEGETTKFKGIFDSLEGFRSDMQYGCEV